MPEELGSLHSARLLGNVLFFVCVALISLSLADPEVRPIDMAVRQLTAMNAAPFERCVEKLRSQQNLLPPYESDSLKTALDLRLPSVFFWTLPQTVEEFNTAFHGRSLAAAVQATLTKDDYEAAREQMPIGSAYLEEIGLTCRYWKAGRKRKVAFLHDRTPVILSYTGFEEAEREVLEDCSARMIWRLGKQGSINMDIPLREEMLSTIQWGGVVTNQCMELLHIPDVNRSHWLAFKALLPYWPEIYSMTPDEAIRYLRARHEAEHRPVSLLGVTFESPLVFMLAHPALIFCLLIFSIHLKQLRHQLADGKVIEDPSVWVALYPGREVPVLVFCAVLVLPMAASISLIMRLETPLQFPHSIVNSIAILLCAGLSLINTRVLLKLRALVMSNKETPAVTG